MTEPSGRRRLWLSVAVGLALAGPVGWVMAPIAVLPFFLGLYFFMLFGLLIGALMYRLALPMAPLSRRAAYLLACAVAAVLWIASLFGEYRYMPKGAFSAVRASTRMVLAPERSQVMRDAIGRHVRAELAREYPPGGLIGYVRWASTGARMEIPRVIDQQNVTYRLKGGGWKWIVRVALSLILTAGAIASQVRGLAAPCKESAVERAQPGDPVV